ncbi:hypothetical protein SJA_C1-09320 [Sphingobium indicum UT26S]|uniref:Uncharacterized protein n=1 Tax=Sphingobium indicum (strain DSM 16413 / CCM 7287 / MTCC 6362 / UT26 / NBRC 101211 / UT26S) TaxID=452662 RepID=D4YZI4_SPHIU|nr:hypothetical protein SJA_C1-09320 [Sphingobium indicum UT26S]
MVEHDRRVDDDPCKLTNNSMDRSVSTVLPDLRTIIGRSLPMIANRGMDSDRIKNCSLPMA